MTGLQPTIDVILPCLDEALALPWLLARMPAGYRPIVADNGSTDGSGRDRRRARRPVVHVPVRGFGAAAHAGLLAATADVVCFWTPTARSTPASCPGSPTRSTPARPTWCSAAGVRPAGGAWPAHARLGNARAGPPAAPPHRGAAARPRPDARRPPGGAARPRHARPPVRLPAGDGVTAAAAAGWRIAEVDVDYAPRPPVPGPRSPARCCGTVRAVRDMRAVLAR